MCVNYQVFVFTFEVQLRMSFYSNQTLSISQMSFTFMCNAAI